MPCELCGKKDTLSVAMIEGTKMQVCQACAGYGKVIQRVEVFQKKRVVIKKEEEVIPEINEEYASLIRKAREKIV